MANSLKQKLVKCSECVNQCRLTDKDFSCLAGTSVTELELIANVLGDGR